MRIRPRTACVCAEAHGTRLRRGYGGQARLYPRDLPAVVLAKVEAPDERGPREKQMQERTTAHFASVLSVPSVA